MALTAEELMIARFKQEAANHISLTPTEDDRAGWLALMQHHGAPTRLMDFTHSPYVAAYFAIEDVKCDEQAAIWSIDSQWCLERAAQALKAHGVPGDANSVAAQVLISELWARLMPDAPCLVLLDVNRHSPRQAAQQGVFVAAGSLLRSFETCLASMLDGADAATSLQCFAVPGSWRREMLDNLKLMNITRASLYPGLDGFTQSLKYSLAIE